MWTEMDFYVELQDQENVFALMLYEALFLFVLMRPVFNSKIVLFLKKVFDNTTLIEKEKQL